MARRKRKSSKKKYEVMIRVGPFNAGVLRAKSLTNARSIARSVATQLPIAPPGMRAAAAEIGEVWGPNSHVIVARFEPHPNGIAEYENEMASVLFGDKPKIHPRQRKLTVVLNPELIEQIAGFFSGGGKKTSRRAPRGTRPARPRTSRRRRR